MDIYAACVFKDCVFLQIHEKLPVYGSGIRETQNNLQHLHAEAAEHSKTLTQDKWYANKVIQFASRKHVYYMHGIKVEVYQSFIYTVRLRERYSVLVFITTNNSCDHALFWQVG